MGLAWPLKLRTRCKLQSVMALFFYFYMEEKSVKMFRCSRTHQIVLAEWIIGDFSTATRILVLLLQCKPIFQMKVIGIGISFAIEWVIE